MLEYRQQTLAALLAEYDLTAVVVAGCSNLRYFCGFTGSNGLFVLTATGSLFVTDGRYTEQAAREVKAQQQQTWRQSAQGLAAALKSFDGQGPMRVGFVAEEISHATFRSWAQAGDPAWEWQPVGEAVARLRACKDAQEVTALEGACRIAEQALQQTLAEVKPGWREWDLAIELEHRMRLLGGEERAFETIVASGPRGALPHGVAGERVLQAGELVTIDFGTRWQGYCSDQTVTIALGKVPELWQQRHQLVVEAQQRAMASVAPGVSLAAIDAAARQVLEEAGLGAYFVHGLGHGVGLDVHELPRLGTRSEATAQEGMVFTLEPGIYIPEQGGIRVEDMVLVTADGCRCLTSLPKELEHWRLA